MFTDLTPFIPSGRTLRVNPLSLKGEGEEILREGAKPPSFLHSPFP